jgi:hypothetical protein
MPFDAPAGRRSGAAAPPERPPSRAQEGHMTAVLTDREVDVEHIEQLFKAAFLRAERDKDGDLVVREDGVNTFIRVDAEKKMITFFSMWGLRTRFSEADKLRFANKLNDELILVRFVVPRPNVLWCDYQFLFEGGITPFQLVNSYKRFVGVCRGAAQRDTADMIGTD